MIHKLTILNIFLGCLILIGVSSCEVNPAEDGLARGACPYVIFYPKCFESARVNLIHNPEIRIYKIEVKDNSNMLIFSKSFIKEDPEISCPALSGTSPDSCKQDNTLGKIVEKTSTKNGAIIEVKVSNLSSEFNRFLDFSILVITNEKVYKKRFQPEIKDVKIDAPHPCTGESTEGVCRNTELTFELD